MPAATSAATGVVSRPPIAWEHAELAALVDAGASHTQARIAATAFADLGDYQAAGPGTRQRLCGFAGDVTAFTVPAGTHLLTETDPAWPAGLADLREPPVVLFCAGTGTVGRPIAGIGPRAPHPAARPVADAVAVAAAQVATTVISGGAAGADTEVHAAAARAQLPTVMVTADFPRRLTGPEQRLCRQLMDRTDLLVISATPPSRSGPGRDRTRRLHARNALIVAAASCVAVGGEPGAGTLSAIGTAVRYQRPVLVPATRQPDRDPVLAVLARPFDRPGRLHSTARGIPLSEPVASAVAASPAALADLLVAAHLFAVS